MKMDEVSGIGPIYEEQLKLAGITTADALLEQGAKPGGRAAIEKATGISEAAGVDSPAELAQRNAANLATTFLEVDAARPDMVRRVPTEAEVATWIAEAKALPKVVDH